MKNNMLTSIVLVFTLFCCEIKACDVCGSNFSYQGLGLLNDYNSNLISLRFNLSDFYSSNGNSKDLQDSYMSMDIVGSYSISERIKLISVIPYLVNIRTIDQQHHRINGFGDVQFVCSVTLLDKLNIGNNWILYLETGIGMSIPTGKYNSKLHDLYLPENFNLGKGTHGILFQPQLALTYKNMDLSVSYNYNKGISSNNTFKFADQMAMQTFVSYTYNLGVNSSIIPFAGIQKEYAGKDRYANGNFVEYSGVKASLFSLGVNSKFKTMMLGIKYSNPISQKYAAGQSILSHKVNVQFYYFF
jgi:hypothetical protein